MPHETNAAIESESQTSTTLIEIAPPPLTGPVLSNMLLGEDEFTEPVHLLRDLSGEQATTCIGESNESIARVVGHMHYWQHRNLAVILGEKPPYPASEEVTWPDVPAESWQGLVSEFLSDLDAMMGITENDEELIRELAEDEAVGDRIRWSAIHNAYHFGQVVLLRRILGYWPPEGGENTW